MLKGLKSALRSRLGLGAIEYRLERLQKQMDFWASWQQLSAPDFHQPRPELWQEAKTNLAAEGIGDFPEIIHQQDLMFAHHLYHNPGEPARALAGYFRVGHRIAAGLARLSESPANSIERLLDFGSGYGRVSRFLPQHFPQAEIHISEIKEGAVRFQREQFGFQAHHHGPEPEVMAGGPYDLIIALSVFTHLPEGNGKLWLKKLSECLQPGGQLIFTFNNIEAKPSGISDQPDYHFYRLSEDSNLNFFPDSLRDTESYGSTYISAERLQSWLDAPEWHWHFLGHQLIPNQETVLLQRKA